MRAAIDHHGGACRREPLGDGVADAGGRAGYQRGLVRKIDFHERFSNVDTLDIGCRMPQRNRGAEHVAPNKKAALGRRF